MIPYKKGNFKGKEPCSEILHLRMEWGTFIKYILNVLRCQSVSEYFQNLGIDLLKVEFCLVFVRCKCICV